MSDPPSKPQPDPHPEPSLDPLPPVQAPSAGFLLQLFVIPLIIVTLIVFVWLMLNWLAHMGSSPQQLVHSLRRLDKSSWQKALTLADLLQNPDYDHLKEDEEMAAELAAILEEQLDRNAGNEESLQLRMFLARALGEFRVPSVLPPLLRAAEQEQESADIAVRRAAIEAIAVYASEADREALRNHEALLETLRDASRERSDNPADREQRAELRSTAAYALGIVGGEEARERLALMTADAYENARYNAGLALARLGDLRSIPILLEMLDPQNEMSVAAGESEFGQASKRLLIITNGMRGAVELAEQNPADDLTSLRSALAEIEDSELTLFTPRARGGIRLNAKETLLTMSKN